jgi:Mrp family chromosome partitioning ATPase
LERVALIDAADISRLSLLLSVERGDPASEAFRAAQPARVEAANTEYDRLLDLRVEARKLQLELGPNHPRVIETQQSIEELEGFLTKQVAMLGPISSEVDFDTNELMEAYVQLLRHDRSELERRSEQLETLVKHEQQEAKDLVSYELRGNTLRRDMERTQALYDAVVDRLREINLIKDYGGVVTEAISPVKPGEKVWPNWPLLLLLGGFVGLVLGSVTAAGRECCDKSFHDLVDVQRNLQLPVLARVPRLGSVGRRATTKTDEEDVPSVQPLVIAYHRPDSAEAEAFRALRAALCFTSGFRDRTVIQVTSPNHDDETATLVSNLAVSLGKAGKGVLLVDCNLSQPCLHRVFGLPAEMGLATFIQGGATLDDVTRVAAPDNVSIVPCGQCAVEEMAELLCRPRFEEFIQTARQGYDVVLLHSQDLAMSDALAVAARADAILLYIRLGQDSRSQAIHARQMLDELGTEVLGLVVGD